MNEDPISSASQAAEQYVNQGQQTANHLREQAPQYAGQVREQAGQMAGQVREQAQRAISESDQYVHQNPWSVILGAAGIGLVLGYALAHRSEPTLRERYVDDPLDHARDALYSILAPVARRVQKEYGHARSAFEDAADHLKSIDPAKETSRLGHKFRFW